MKKSVLITGSSHGIGAACAVAFAREGYDVGINYLHSPEDAQKVAEQCRELGADAQIYQADVSLHEDCVRMIDAFIEHFGKIDVLVNNAGGALKMPKGGFVDMPVEYWNKQIDLNLNSAMYCSQAAARDMIAKGIHGAIINISSIHSLVTWVRRKALPYSAGKAGLNMFTKSIGVELIKYGINVNCIAPGLVYTPTRTSRASTARSLRDAADSRRKSFPWCCSLPISPRAALLWARPFTSTAASPSTVRLTICWMRNSDIS